MSTVEPSRLAGPVAVVLADRSPPDGRGMAGGLGARVVGARGVAGSVGRCGARGAAGPGRMGVVVPGRVRAFGRGPVAASSVAAVRAAELDRGWRRRAGGPASCVRAHGVGPRKPSGQAAPRLRSVRAKGSTVTLVVRARAGQTLDQLEAGVPGLAATLDALSWRCSAHNGSTSTLLVELVMHDALRKPRDGTVPLGTDVGRTGSPVAARSARRRRDLGADRRGAAHAGGRLLGGREGLGAVGPGRRPRPAGAVRHGPAVGDRPQARGGAADGSRPVRHGGRHRP